jgi:phosphatidylserine decarboxylase
LISKYGLDVVGAILLLVAVGSLLAWNFIAAPVIRITLIAVFLLLLAFTLYFFRDPERVTPSGDANIIAPADGEVILIQDVREDEYLKCDAVQISIFMSPLNVHVNRFPITGTVGYFQHVPGAYVMAFEEKASLKNERTLIGVENGRIKILFKQIAGFIARRIVADLHVGDPAEAGKRFGMIKFGSRVDVLLPRGLQVRVKVGDRTTAGETILAVVP